MPPRWSLKI